MGGRPPYGYRLADAGPHPNRIHAAWGRRLHRLEPDPATAPHVKWMFAQRLAGHSTASIARALNERGVLCPSAADPNRNPHRHRRVWVLRTVAAILANPRYTGRQVWNRQRTDRDPRHHADALLRHDDVQRWNPTDQWVISAKIAHTPLVNEADFIAAQAITAIPTPADGSTRTYLLVGLLICRRCGRRMDAHWVHRRPGYRCRHGHTSAKSATGNRPGNLYVREDHILARIATQVDDLRTGPAPVTELDRRQIATFLRAHNMTVICDADTCDIETHRSRSAPLPAATCPTQGT
jgi:site-specific DNA recombinase